MKKIILSLVLLAGISGAASAQGLKLGLKGGFNGATFVGSTAHSYGYKAGFAAGGLINYGINDHVSVQGELLYSQHGASLDYDFGSGTTYTSKTTLGYLDVPILFKYNLGDDGKGLFFELGPQGSFVINQRSFTEDSGGKQVGDSDTSTDLFNKVAINYLGGIGYQITSGLGIGVRYVGGISQVFKDGGTTKTTTTTVGGSTITTSVDVPSTRTSVFQFQVHYLFGGDK